MAPKKPSKAKSGVTDPSQKLDKLPKEIPKIKDERTEGTTADSGSRVINKYVEYSMKIFAVPEDTIHSLSLLNTLALTFFSLGSFFLSQGIDFFKEKIFGDIETKLSPDAVLTYQVLQNILFWIGIGFIALGVVAIAWKQWKIHKVKKNSKEITNSVNR